MIVNPYSEIISLHDMDIKEFTVKDGKAIIKLCQTFLFSATADYVLDNPEVIVNDLIEIQTNEDYPVRIKLFNDDEAISLTIDDFKDYKFNILEEAYGFGLVHFYGIATKLDKAYDCLIDIHYCGDLEINWDNKVLVEA
ncbi:hypothetical protein JNO63_07415 [Anaerococcus sp. mt242]|uniref:hypothetical protein n=1 Tax=Anaerococcus sp. mt242 TaxID=2661917 RepID=UPI001931FBC3|nr:hypothetical protein [Anaerococcus sp. mt242]MBM0046920.1 hypothetical protein [Anaerococcus sp. mt242]